MAVFDRDAPLLRLCVAYGNSQRNTALYLGAFAILRERNRAAYAAARLRYDMKLNLKQALDLPYSAEQF